MIRRPLRIRPDLAKHRARPANMRLRTLEMYLHDSLQMPHLTTGYYDQIEHALRSGVT